jgi:hypothetical protein
MTASTSPVGAFRLFAIAAALGAKAGDISVNVQRYCPNCDRRLSDAAPYCPRCGWKPIQENPTQ